MADDGSTDGTSEIVRSFGGRVQLLQLPHRGGNITRNVLLDAARGEWLQYLDADDYLFPNKIADQMESLGTTAGAVDVVYSPFVLRYESTRQEIRGRLKMDRDIFSRFIYWQSLWTGALLLRRSAVIEVGRWKEDQVACQEHELLLRLLCAGKQFALWNQAAAVYRYHTTNTVSRKDPLRTIRLRMELTDQCERFLKESKRMLPQHRKALYTARMECARSAWNVDPDYARRLAREATTTGRWMVSDSAALPKGFQFTSLLFGFGLAQKIAAARRRRNVPPGSDVTVRLTSQRASPLVSILIPAYNAERWIHEAITSALGQTYSSKEVIVADDGSTDETAKIIRTFGDRIRFVQLSHAGGNAARNALLELAQGEWLQYLDSDDFLLPTKVADQIAYLEENNWRFDVIYSPFMVRSRGDEDRGRCRDQAGRKTSGCILFNGMLFLQRAWDSLCVARPSWTSVVGKKIKSPVRNMSCCYV